MVYRHLLRQRRRGLACVELALLLPFLLVMLLGIWEVGRLINVNQILSNSAREGARLAATGKHTSSQVTAEVQYYLYQAMRGQGMSDAAATQVKNDAVVTVVDLDNVGVDPTNATKLDRLHVTVTIPFNDVHWVALYLITNPTSTLFGEATWVSTRDQPFPTAVTAPAGF
jgi:Flp pilus assembly protein TadG